MTELLPCPFCAGKAVEVTDSRYKHTFSKERAGKNAGDLSLIAEETGYKRTYYAYTQYLYGVWCENKDCPGHTRVRYHSRDTAIDAWNRRTP